MSELDDLEKYESKRLAYRNRSMSAKKRAKSLEISKNHRARGIKFGKGKRRKPATITLAKVTAS